MFWAKTLFLKKVEKLGYKQSYFVTWTFIWMAKWHREEEKKTERKTHRGREKQVKDMYLLSDIPHPKCPHSQIWARHKPRTRNPLLLSKLCGIEERTWSKFDCLPRKISRKLDHKWNNQQLNPQCDMDCWRFSLLNT